VNRKYRLWAKWNPKERELEFHYPLGIQTQSDGSILADCLNPKFLAELQRRGYGVETLKFSVDIDFESKEAEGRFPTLRREWGNLLTTASRGC
jgi:hypothetical protein